MATYRLTREGYILYPICVVDSHERTLTVALIMVSDEETNTLVSAFKHFKESNKEEVINQIKYCIMDKATHEINSCQEVLPQCTFLLLSLAC